MGGVLQPPHLLLQGRREVPCTPSHTKEPGLDRSIINQRNPAPRSGGHCQLLCFRPGRGGEAAFFFGGGLCTVESSGVCVRQRTTFLPGLMPMSYITLSSIFVPRIPHNIILLVNGLQRPIEQGWTLLCIEFVPPKNAAPSPPISGPCTQNVRSP